MFNLKEHQARTEKDMVIFCGIQMRRAKEITVLRFFSVVHLVL
jgi:hypothetical protein